MSLRVYIVDTQLRAFKENCALAGASLKRNQILSRRGTPTFAAVGSTRATKVDNSNSFPATISRRFLRCSQSSGGGRHDCDFDAICDAWTQPTIRRSSRFCLISRGVKRAISTGFGNLQDRDLIGRDIIKRALGFESRRIRGASRVGLPVAPTHFGFDALHIPCVSGSTTGPLHVGWMRDGSAFRPCVRGSNDSSATANRMHVVCVECSNIKLSLNTSGVSLRERGCSDNSAPGR